MSKSFSNIIPVKVCGVCGGGGGGIHWQIKTNKPISHLKLSKSGQVNVCCKSARHDLIYYNVLVSMADVNISGFMVHFNGIKHQTSVSTRNCYIW